MRMLASLLCLSTSPHSHADFCWTKTIPVRSCARLGPSHVPVARYERKRRRRRTTAPSARRRPMAPEIPDDHTGKEVDKAYKEHHAKRRHPPGPPKHECQRHHEHAHRDWNPIVDHRWPRLLKDQQVGGVSRSENNVGCLLSGCPAWLTITLSGAH